MSDLSIRGLEGGPFEVKCLSTKDRLFGAKNCDIKDSNLVVILQLFDQLLQNGGNNRLDNERQLLYDNQLIILQNLSKNSIDSIVGQLSLEEILLLTSKQLQSLDLKKLSDEVKIELFKKLFRYCITKEEVFSKIEVEKLQILSKKLARIYAIFFNLQMKENIGVETISQQVKLLSQEEVDYLIFLHLANIPEDREICRELIYYLDVNQINRVIKKFSFSHLQYLSRKQMANLDINKFEIDQIKEFLQAFIRYFKEDITLYKEGDLWFYVTIFSPEDTEIVSFLELLSKHFFFLAEKIDLRTLTKAERKYIIKRSLKFLGVSHKKEEQDLLLTNRIIYKLMESNKWNELIEAASGLNLSEKQKCKIIINLNMIEGRKDKFCKFIEPFLLSLNGLYNTSWYDSNLNIFSLSTIQEFYLGEFNEIHRKKMLEEWISALVDSNDIKKHYAAARMIVAVCKLQEENITKFTQFLSDRVFNLEQRKIFLVNLKNIVHG